MSTIDCNKKYYIANTFWKDKLDLAKVPKFNNIKYTDILILHFGIQQSLSKIMLNIRDNKIFIAILNVALRFYQTVKNIYPYNKVYIILYYTKNYKNSLLDFDTFKTIVDIIPNFALIGSFDDLDFFKTDNYKHIFYNMDTLQSVINMFDSKQIWQNFNGKLMVRS